MRRDEMISSREYGPPHRVGGVTVLVVGSINQDTTIEVERLPREGETLLATGLRTALGGKGANQAITCARMGVHTVLVGAVGDDGAGTALRALLTAEPLDVTHVATIPGVPSGQALITVDARGANTIVVAAGANATLTASPRVEEVAVVLAQLEVPQAAIRAAYAAAPGATRILNPAPAAAIDALVDLCDVLIPNEHEAAALTGHADPVQAARALGVETVIVTCGGRGVVVVHRGGPPRRFPAIPVDVVDTVAAGDAFCGAFAAATARGADLDDAVWHGIAAGAHAVTVAGALPSLPSQADVDRLLGEAEAIHHLR